MVNPRFFAIALAGALTACSGGGGSTAHVGRPAPDWTEQTASGSKMSLSSLRGKAVYLNFFATWCTPCNEEAPYINALQKQYGPQGLQTIGVDELENAKKAKQFVDKYRLVYPTVLDDDGTLAAQYRFFGLPTHVFISRSGVIEEIHPGEMSKAQIAAAIRSIL
jgi:peroxiredoxin